MKKNWPVERVYIFPAGTTVYQIVSMYVGEFKRFLSLFDDNSPLKTALIQIRTLTAKNCNKYFERLVKMAYCYDLDYEPS